VPINKSQVTKIISLDLSGIPEDQVDDAKQEVLNFIKEQMLSDFAKATSPVTGDDFVPLSKKYEKYKETKSSAPIANMELTGAMLDALDAIDKGGNKIEIGWFDSDQAVKAFNHTTGDTVPKRPLIPGKGEDFRGGIMDEIQSILDGYRSDNGN
jgi:hypothetical protein